MFSVDYLQDLFGFGTLALMSFIAIANPINIIPLFLSMSEGYSDAEKRKIIRTSCITAFFVLIVFTLSGQLIFKVFGISATGLKIIGGIILFEIGYGMLKSKDSKSKDSKMVDLSRNIAITPMAIPILAGPGSIANGLILMQEHNDIPHAIVLVLSILALYIIEYICLRASTKIVKIMGANAMNLMARLMGLLLMVIAAEFMIAGVKDVFNLS